MDFRKQENLTRENQMKEGRMNIGCNSARVKKARHNSSVDLNKCGKVIAEPKKKKQL
jgi:hypothetical protein